jgi:hypothetical protein
MHKARQAIAVQKAIDAGEMSVEVGKAIVAGKRKLKDATKLIPGKKNSAGEKEKLVQLSLDGKWQSLASDWLEKHCPCSEEEYFVAVTPLMPTHINAFRRSADSKLSAAKAAINKLVREKRFAVRQGRIEKVSSVDTSGPRELKSPKSAGYALQTVRALKRYLESLLLDQERVNEELSRIKEYRHWEVLGFASQREMLASHGIDVEKLERYSTANESLSLTEHVDKLADYLTPFVRSLKDISGDQWQEADRSSRRRLLMEIDALAAIVRSTDQG